MKLNKKLLGGSLAGLIAAILAVFGVSPKPKPEGNPTPTPTPVASPSVLPTVLPTPTAAASPTTTTTPEVLSCDLAASTGKCVWPPVDPAEFKNAVEIAQDTAFHNGFVVGGRVKDEGEYVREVARLLRSMGYCAIQGKTVQDEVWVKFSNGFSEHWDVVRSDGEPITLYASRCTPAAF